MSSEAGAISVLLLTEDTGEESLDCLWALLHAMLRELAPHSVRLAEVLRLEPAAALAREAMGTNKWKEHGVGGAERRRRLAQALATHLLRGERRFAVVHIDADVVWSARERGSENLDRFEAEVRRVVRAQLEGRGASTRAEHLLVLAPYYHLESWLFQNTPVLGADYARRHPGGHPELALVQAWAADPRALDEVYRPKMLLATVKNRLNTQLASSAFPVRRAASAGKSFAAAMEQLRSCTPLQAALRAHAAAWERNTWETPRE